MAWLASVFPEITAAGSAGWDRALGDHQLQRLQAALVHGNVLAHQRSEDVEHHRPADRGRGIVVERVLRRGACEIQPGAASGVVDADRHPDFRARVQPVGEARVAEHVDDPAHALFGVVFDMVHVGVDRRQSILLDQRPQRLLPGAVGGDLGGEVGHVLFDVAAGIVTGQQ